MCDGRFLTSTGGIRTRRPPREPAILRGPKAAALLLAFVALVLPGSTAVADCNPFRPIPDPTLDPNCDGRTSIYCGADFGAVDLYANALVTGFLVHDGGTYELVGDESLDGNGNGIADYLEPDGLAEDFFFFVDVGGPSGYQDGRAWLDPALAGQIITEPGDYGDPAACNTQGQCDQVLFFPAGDATGSVNGDAESENPNCDFFAQDAWESCILVVPDTASVEQSVPFPAGQFTAAIRGDVAQLTPVANGLDLGSVSCLGVLPQPSTYPDPALPQSGQIFFYLLQMDDGSRYPYGACTGRFVSPGNGACDDP
jgi:hypothetical protein